MEEGGGGGEMETEMQRGRAIKGKEGRVAGSHRARWWLVMCDRMAGTQPL